MTFLLDVNVLVALAWPAHTSHKAAQRWFGASGKRWATCPMTQCGFVRILSNPAFSPQALRPQEALSLLQRNVNHPGHDFWPDDVDLLTAVQLGGRRLSGHQQITDAYLLGLASRRKGKLATLDQSLAASTEASEHYVEPIR